MELSAALTWAHLVACDPGDKNVGLSIWERRTWPNGEGTRWKETWRGIVTPEELRVALYETDLIVATRVVEDFRLDHGRTKGGSRMVASEVIGMLRATGPDDVIRQSPEAYRIEAMHLGETWDGKHCPDDLSAYLHASYYLRSIRATVVR
jgi:hypothetical protein